MAQDYVAIRAAHEALAQVGIQVNILDPYVLEIKNQATDKTTKITREQACVLAAHLGVLAEAVVK